MGLVQGKERVYRPVRKIKEAAFVGPGIMGSFSPQEYRCGYQDVVS